MNKPKLQFKKNNSTENGLRQLQSRFFIETAIEILLQKNSGMIFTTNVANANRFFKGIHPDYFERYFTSSTIARVSCSQ